MSEMMKAARLHQIGQFQVDEVPVPVPQGEQLLVVLGRWAVEQPGDVGCRPQIGRAHV